MRADPWYKVLDAYFNLHLNTTATVSFRVGYEPTDGGPVTSLELIAGDSDLIAQPFGLRKPGTPELAGWRRLTM